MPHGFSRRHTYVVPTLIGAGILGTVSLVCNFRGHKSEVPYGQVLTVSSYERKDSNYLNGRQISDLSLIGDETIILEDLSPADCNNYLALLRKSNKVGFPTKEESDKKTKRGGTKQQKMQRNGDAFEIYDPSILPVVTETSGSLP